MQLRAIPERLATTDATFDAKLAARLVWEASTDAGIESTVTAILDDVRRRGDAAVLELTRRFDHVSAPDMAALVLSPSDMHAAYIALPAAQRAALDAAAERVRSYHQAQKRACGESWQ